MKKLLLLILLSASFYTVSGQSQSGLSIMYGEADKLVNKKMDAIYQRILMVYADDTLFIKSFTRSQRAWLQFRAAEIKAQFPDYPPGYYGTMASMCYSIYARQLTEQRIQEMEQWLIGNKHGTCASSVRYSTQLPPYTPYDPHVIDSIRDHMKVR